jgi:hypothetical protein
MKCNGCGEEYHGAASCLATVKWELVSARQEIVRLKRELMQSHAALQVPALLAKPDSRKIASERMKKYWAEKKAAKALKAN